LLCHARPSHALPGPALPCVGAEVSNLGDCQSPAITLALPDPALPSPAWPCVGVRASNPDGCQSPAIP